MIERPGVAEVQARKSRRPGDVADGSVEGAPEVEGFERGWPADVVDPVVEVVPEAETRLSQKWANASLRVRIFEAHPTTRRRHCRSRSLQAQ